MNSPGPAVPQLHDIHLPGRPDFWPPAAGWWLLAAVLLAVAVWLSVRTWRYLRLRRQRRLVLALLEQTERASADTATPDFLAELSRLTRRLALMRYPRNEVAALTGQDWLRFLDRSGGNGQFSNGPGRVLAVGPYVRVLSDKVDRQALLALVRQWILRNTGD